MKLFITFSLFLFSLSTLAQTPLFRPVGEFLYTKEVLLTSMRTAESVSHISTEGKSRIKELKSDGFICVRKNQQLSICQKIEKNLETPDFIQNAVNEYLQKAKFSFSGNGTPEIIHDGANTEWLISETVMLGNKKIEMYKIIKTADDLWFASFPVSNEQGIGNMQIFSDERLGLPLTLQGKNTTQTISYFITAIFNR